MTNRRRGAAPLSPPADGVVSERNGAQPPTPRLTPEWRLRVVTEGGSLYHFPAESREGAVELARTLKCPTSTWVVEHRNVTEWMATSQPMTTTTTVRTRPAEKENAVVDETEEINARRAEMGLGPFPKNPGVTLYERGD